MNEGGERRTANIVHTVLFSVLAIWHGKVYIILYQHWFQQIYWTLPWPRHDTRIVSLLWMDFLMFSYFAAYTFAL